MGETKQAQDRGGARKPRRQEQEDAREEVTEVAPGVLRMELPIRIPGLGHVNCYGLVDGDGIALVDPGLPTPGSYATLKSRLAQADFEVRHVHTVIVTHSHPDHFGGAIRLVRETGATLVAHVGFQLGSPSPDEELEVSVEDLHAHSHAHDHDHGDVAPHESGSDPGRTDAHINPAREPFVPPQPAYGRRGKTPWGGAYPRPPLTMRMRFRLMRMIGRGLGFPEVSRPVGAGDVLRLCGREFFVMHTPGHTQDHICLHDPEERLFLAGDHVLPSITPHISGISAGDPLDDFFDSLDRAAATPDVENVLPAHGHPFGDLAARCEAIKEHHYERLDKVRAIAREIGPASVEAFTQKLFRPRSWGAMAESETYAHLEHIRHAGGAERHRDRKGMLIYEI